MSKSALIFGLLTIMAIFYIWNTEKILSLSNASNYNSKSSRREFNPWHDIDPGTDAPRIVDVFIEIPYKSQVKYEIDKAQGFLRVDRILDPNFAYPTNYGFIPKTLYLDGDPLDALVISDHPIAAGAVVTARVIGVLKMKDQGAQDDKILCVAIGEKKYDQIKVPEDFKNLDEVSEFFKNYKKPEGKKVVVEGVEGHAEALDDIRLGFKLYKEKFE
jgi:inorganic pyrophosphatase